MRMQLPSCACLHSHMVGGAVPLGSDFIVDLLEADSQQCLCRNRDALFASSDGGMEDAEQGTVKGRGWKDAAARLQPGPKVRGRHTLAVTDAAVDYPHRRRPHLLRQLHVLEKAQPCTPHCHPGVLGQQLQQLRRQLIYRGTQAVQSQRTISAPVAPQIPVAAALIGGADGLFPPEGPLQHVPLHVAAPRKTQESADPGAFQLGRHGRVSSERGDREQHASFMSMYACTSLFGV